MGNSISEEEIGKKPTSASELEEAAARVKRAEEVREHLARIAFDLNALGELVKTEVSPEGGPVAGAATTTTTTGNWNLAATYHEEALEVRERLYPNADHRDLATSLCNLGLCHYRLGDTLEAISLFERSLEVFIKANGGSEESLDAATVMNNLAKSLLSVDQVRAKAVGRRGLEIRKKILGESHPHVAILVKEWGEAE